MMREGGGVMDGWMDEYVMVARCDVFIAIVVIQSGFSNQI